MNHGMAKKVKVNKISEHDIEIRFTMVSGEEVIVQMNEGLCYHMRHKIDQAVGVEPLSPEDAKRVQLWGMRP